MHEESWTVEGKPVYVLRRGLFVWSYRIGQGRWQHTLKGSTAIRACKQALNRARKEALPNVGLVKAGDYVLSKDDIERYFDPRSLS